MSADAISVGESHGVGLGSPPGARPSVPGPPRDAPAAAGRDRSASRPRRGLDPRMRTTRRGARSRAAETAADEPERGRDRRQQLPVRPGEDRPRRVVVRPRVQHRARRGRPRPRGRRRGRAGRRRRAGSDRLGEPLAIVLDEADRPVDHRSAGSGSSSRDRRDAARAAPHRRGEQDPPDVGQPPTVDRLVVVADEEDPVRRRGEEQRQRGAGLDRGPGPRRRGDGRTDGATRSRSAGSSSSRRNARATRSSKSSPPVAAIAAS